MANQMMSSGVTPSGLTRERSFVRTPQTNKRRSLAMTSDTIDTFRLKPAIEIYRPPSNDLKMIKI